MNDIEIKTKVCSKCGIEKDVGEFHKSKTTLQYICKMCKKEYYETNKSYINKQRSEYRAKSKDKIKAQNKIYRHLNKEKIHNWQRQHYDENKKNKQEYYIANKDRIKKRNQNKFYGVSQEKKIIEQNNKCKICGVDFSTMRSKFIHTDHNHSTKAFRGILCHHCNQILKGINKYEDVKLHILDKSIEYLQKKDTSIMYTDKWRSRNKNKNQPLYYFLLDNCSNKCEICNLELTREYKMSNENREIFPFIDHNHITGFIRGILCSKCNMRLGHAKDNYEILSSAKIYLIQHNNMEINNE